MEKTRQDKEEKQKGLIVIERIYHKTQGLLQEKILGVYRVIRPRLATSINDASFLRLEHGFWFYYSSRGTKFGEIVETTKILFDDNNKECGEKTRTVLITTENDPNWDFFLNLLKKGDVK